MRDGWWWLSNPLFTVAVLVEGGRIIKGPPIVWKSNADYIYDRFAFLAQS